MIRWIYRLALLACPSDVRRDYGRELEAGFEQSVRIEAGRHGIWFQPVVWWRGFHDLFTFAAAARRDRRAPRVVLSLQSRPTRSAVVKLQDIRIAFRLVRKQPWLSSAIILMLALGIGATTAIFSVVNGVLLRPLPFPDQERIVRVLGTRLDRGWGTVSLTEANFWDMKDQIQSFAEFGVFHSASFTMTGGESPERVSGAQVSVGFLRALGVTPPLGRLFVPGEDNPGADPRKVILSFRAWRERFGADPAIVGRTLTLNGQPYQVVGVLPRGTPLIDAADAYVPFIRRADANRGSYEYLGIARLNAGVSMAAALAEVDSVAKQLERRFPGDNTGLGATLDSSRLIVASDELRRTLWILLVAVSLLLVIACVNVVNLLLARASSQVRERAVRAALGATRGDLIRERLTEAIVFAMVGAGLGLAVASGILQTLRALDPGGIPRLAEASIDAAVFGFAAGIALFVGVCTGLVPAVQSSRQDLVPALRQGQRGAMGDRRQLRLRNLFVCAEVALSLMLLIGAGLLVRSLVQVMNVDRGFASEHRLMATVTIPPAYSGGRSEQVATAILAQIRGLPEVINVAAVSGRPLSRGSTGMGIAAADAAGDTPVPWAAWRIITADYFKTLNLPLLSGRTFTEHDVIGKPWRVVIGKRLADRLWPGQSPIGRTAVLWKGQNNYPAEVIGVVGDMRERGLDVEPPLAVYMPATGNGVGQLQLILHTQIDPTRVVPALRAAVKAIDPMLPVSSVSTLDDAIDASVATRRFTMALIATFAGAAFLLALAGVYGVIAYAVARRTSEIGVRLALGAQHRRVLGLVVAQGIRPIAIGLALGLAAAFWLSQFMESMLFGVTARDPITFAGATLVLCATGALACYLPSRRVLRVDPVVALRAE